MNRRSLFACLLLLTAGCATTTAPRYYSDFDPSVDFGRYRTYCWTHSKVPPGVNPFLLERVAAAIERVLAARGYQKVEGGELGVGFNLAHQYMVEPGYYGYNSSWGPSVRTEGALTIDIYDNATRRPVWHGVVAQEIVSEGPVDQARLDQAIDALMRQFPPPPRA